MPKFLSLIGVQMDAADCARCTTMDVIGSLSSATGIPATKHLTFLKDCIYTYI
jgi:hypothetical protein